MSVIIQMGKLSQRGGRGAYVKTADITWVSPGGSQDALSPFVTVNRDL